MRNGRYDAIHDAEGCIDCELEDDETAESITDRLIEEKEANLQEYLEDYKITLRAIVPDMLAEYRAKANEDDGAA